MKEQLTTLETAKLAKEKGFNLLCNTINYTDESGNSRSESLHSTLINEDFENLKRLYYKYPSRCVSIPSQSLLQKWLRETHNIRVEVGTLIDASYSYSLYLIEQNNNYGKQVKFEYTEQFSYETALEQALIDGLKLIK